MSANLNENIRGTCFVVMGFGKNLFWIWPCSGLGRGV